MMECPCCGAAEIDIESAWAEMPPADEHILRRVAMIMQKHYPEAKHCNYCGHTWDEKRRRDDQTLSENLLRMIKR